MATGLSVVNLAFVLGFGLMLVQAMDTALISERVFYLLFLPVLSVPMTVGVVLLLAWEWKSRDGTGKETVFGALFGLAAVGFLWFLDYWNLLGWYY